MADDEGSAPASGPAGADLPGSGAAVAPGPAFGVDGEDAPVKDRSVPGAPGDVGDGGGPTRRPGDATVAPGGGGGDVLELADEAAEEVEEDPGEAVTDAGQAGRPGGGSGVADGARASTGRAVPAPEPVLGVTAAVPTASARAAGSTPGEPAPAAEDPVPAAVPAPPAGIAPAGIAPVGGSGDGDPAGVAPVGGPASGAPAVDARVSDDDRERTAIALRAHFREGRLDTDEFADRVGLAYAARTRTELDAVLADLPALPPGSLVLPEPTRRASRKRRSLPMVPRRRVVGVFSGGRAMGRWQPAEQVHAVAVVGSAVVDLTEVLGAHRAMVVHAVAVLGGIEVIVPEGVSVDLVGTAVLGSKSWQVAQRDVPEGAPHVTVWVRAVLGGVTVRTRKRGTGSARPAPG